MEMQSTQKIDSADQARTTAAFPGDAFFGRSPDALLKAENDLLAGAETAMSEWLHRRREAVSDARRLFARIRESRDLSDVFKAQQDWMNGALRRLADDAESCQRAALGFATVASRELGKTEQAFEADVQRAAETAGGTGKATRAAAE
jgi:hypothetical protein